MHYCMDRAAQAVLGLLAWHGSAQLDAALFPKAEELQAQARGSRAMR